MPFIFGQNLPAVLPKHDYDLRWYLEKHLMIKPDLDNDYEQFDGDTDSLHDQKKSIASVKKVVKEMKERLAYATEVHSQKVEAVGNSRINFVV